MTRSQLAGILAEKYTHMTQADCERVISVIIEGLMKGLNHYKRVELRGFGVFTLNRHKAHSRPNPETGKMMHLEDRHIPRFSPSDLLIRRLNA